jgi:hypothetical protein
MMRQPLAQTFRESGRKCKYNLCGAGEGRGRMTLYVNIEDMWK